MFVSVCMYFVIFIAQYADSWAVMLSRLHADCDQAFDADCGG